MTMIPLRLALASLALAPFASAADTAAPAPVAAGVTSSAPVNDYSGAFEKLFEFGLPDTRGATFVKTSVAHDPYGSQPGVVPTLNGFAWRTASADKSKTKVIVHGIAVFEGIADTDASDHFATVSVFTYPAKHPPGTPFPSAIPLTESDLRQTVSAAHTQLLAWKTARDKTPTDATDKNRGRNDWAERQTPDRLAPYLILAAHAHRAGFTDEANRLADLALSCAVSPEPVIKAAVSPLADIRWRAAMHTWSRSASRSPEDLAKELETISARYAGVWKQAPAARHLLRVLRQNKAAPEPSIPGRTFTAEQLRVATDLLNLAELPADTDWLAPAKPGAKQPPLITSLRALGIEAIPLLAALADDTSPTSCLPPVSQHESFTDFGDNDDESQREWREKNAYAQWQARPLTRGEIVTRLIAMPKSFCLDVSEDSTRSRSLLADYETLKAEGKIGLLLEKADSARNWNRDRAWRAVFAAITSDADADKLQEALINLPDKSPVLPLLAPYLRKRGQASADFLQKFAAAARADLEEVDETAFAAKAKDNQYQMSFRMRGATPPETKAEALADLTQQIDKLSPLVAAKSAKTAGSSDPLVALLDEIESADTPAIIYGSGDDTESPSARLRALLAEGENPWEKLIPSLFARTAKARDFKTRFTFLNLATNLVYQTKSAQEPTREQLARIIPHCRAILAASENSLQHRMAMLQSFESLLGGRRVLGMNSGFQALQYLDWQEGASILSARFEARAAGATPPEWPAAEKVPAARLKAILDDFVTAADTADFRSRHAKLSLDEKVAWGVEIQKPASKLPTVVTQARSRIRSVLTLDPVAKTCAEPLDLDSFVGRDTDEKTMRDLLARIRKSPPASAVSIAFGQAPTGVILHVSDLEALGMRGLAPAGKIQAHTFRQIRSADGNTRFDNAQAVFLLADASLDTTAGEKFWKLLGTPLAEGESVLMSQVSFNVPASKKSEKSK